MCSIGGLDEESHACMGGLRLPITNVHIILDLKVFFYRLPFIENNILMSLFRIARLLLLFGLDLFEDRRRVKRPFVKAQKQ